MFIEKKWHTKITIFGNISLANYNKIGIIVYKSANKYIITLGIPLAVSKTNLNRHVDDKNFAKYRTNCVDILEIQDKITGELISSISSDFDKDFIYEINTRIILDDKGYDDKQNLICVGGIHFYTTREAAFWHNFKKIIPKTGNFTAKGFSDDGFFEAQYYYIDGKLINATFYT